MANSPLNVKEQDTFCRLLKKIHEATMGEDIPCQLLADAKEMLAFCRKMLPKDGKEHTFDLGRSSFTIRADTERKGFNWDKHYASYEVTTHYVFKFSAEYVRAYHNDSELHENAVIIGTRVFPFGLPNPVRIKVEL